MNLLNENYAEATNFIAIKGYLIEAKSVLTTSQAYIDKTVPTFADLKDTGGAHNNLEDNKRNLGHLVEKISRYTKIVTTLTKLTTELTELMQYCVKHIKYYAAQALIKDIEEISLRIKRAILHVKLRIAKDTRKMLIGCSEGVAAGALASLIMSVISAFQVLSKLIMVALQAIDKILSLIPEPMAVLAETMAFLMTPKSMKKTNIVPINANKSIADRLPQSVKTAIMEATKAIDKLNVPIKVASIAACAAAGAAAAKRNDNDFTVKACKALKLLDPKSILKAVETILLLLPVPQGLPKYERLSIINLGFDAWLMTSFVPSGKKTFGMPGMP